MDKVLRLYRLMNRADALFSRALSRHHGESQEAYIWARYGGISKRHPLAHAAAMRYERLAEAWRTAYRESLAK